MATRIPKDAAGDRWLWSGIHALLKEREREMGTMWQYPIIAGKPSQAVESRRWNLGLGCTSYAAKQVMEKIRQEELQRRRLQYEKTRNGTQPQKGFRATQESFKVPVKPQSSTIWLFPLLDRAEETHEEGFLQRKEKRREKTKEKVKQEKPPKNGAEDQVPCKAPKPRRHLFSFVGWKEEEELAKLCEPWPLEDTLKKRLAQNRQHQGRQRDDLLSSKRGRLRLHLWHASEKSTSPGLRRSVKRPLDEAEIKKDMPPKNGAEDQVPCKAPKPRRHLLTFVGWKKEEVSSDPPAQKAEPKGPNHLKAIINVVVERHPPGSRDGQQKEEPPARGRQEERLAKLCEPWSLEDTLKKRLTQNHQGRQQDDLLSSKGGRLRLHLCNVSSDPPAQKAEPNGPNHEKAVINVVVERHPPGPKDGQQKEEPPAKGGKEERASEKSTSPGLRRSVKRPLDEAEVESRRWNLGLGCTSYAAKQIMEKIRQEELRRRRLQYEKTRNGTQPQKGFRATQESLKVHVKPQSSTIWLFPLLDRAEETHEERFLQRKEKRREKTKEKVKQEMPPKNGAEDQVPCKAPKPRRHLFSFVGWKEEEEVSSDPPAQKAEPNGPNLQKAQPTINTVVEQHFPEPRNGQQKEEPPARGRKEERLEKLCEPWPLEDTLKKRLAQTRKHQGRQRDDLLSSKRGRLRLHLWHASEKSTSPGLRRSVKRPLDEAEDLPPANRQKTDHLRAVPPRVLEDLNDLCDGLNKLEVAPKNEPTNIKKEMPSKNGAEVQVPCKAPKPRRHLFTFVGWKEEEVSSDSPAQKAEPNGPNHQKAVINVVVERHPPGPRDGQQKEEPPARGRKEERLVKLCEPWTLEDTLKKRLTQNRHHQGRQRDDLLSSKGGRLRLHLWNASEKSTSPGLRRSIKRPLDEAEDLPPANRQKTDHLRAVPSRALEDLNDLCDRLNKLESHRVPTPMATRIPKDAAGDRWLWSGIHALLKEREREMGTMWQYPIIAGKPSQAVESRRWNLGLGCTSYAAKQIMEKIRQVPVKPQSSTIWLFPLLDRAEETHEERFLQRKEKRREKIKEKVKKDMPPRNGAEDQVPCKAPKPKRHLFSFVGWKEEEEVSSDPPAQKAEPNGPNLQKAQPTINTVVEQHFPEPRNGQQKEEPPARGRKEERLEKLCEPWPLEDTLKKRLAQTRKHQGRQRDDLLSSKRGRLRLHLWHASEKSTSPGLRRSVKRPLDEAEIKKEMPPKNGAEDQVPCKAPKPRRHLFTFVGWKEEEVSSDPPAQKAEPNGPNHLKAVINVVVERHPPGRRDGQQKEEPPARGRKEERHQMEQIVFLGDSSGLVSSSYTFL
ncbi:trichohyalin-like [Tiliqua scincoides]|uniref:trichohyalin-like n=1 Tax=Tiliqua scincoides TaxID=71010 RepID=UPI003462C9EC